MPNGVPCAFLFRERGESRTSHRDRDPWGDRETVTRPSLCRIAGDICILKSSQLSEDHAGIRFGPGKEAGSDRFPDAWMLRVMTFSMPALCISRGNESLL